MPKVRHDGALIRTFGISFLSPQTIEYPVRGWDQLIYATDGVLTVDTEIGSWVLPAQRALWVPDGVRHRLEIRKAAELRCLYFRRLAARQLPRSCCAVNVSPLLRELILACVAEGALRSRVPQHRRLAGVVMDQLRVLPAVPLQLPLPEDERACRMVKILRAEPGLSLPAAAGLSGTGLRTLERLFRLETGMALGAWFRRLRLQIALESLAGGASVAEAARVCGYNGASAFVSMFRRELGVTPGQLMDGSNGKRGAGAPLSASST
jgi:AraC-like DNA-binding protein